MLTREVLKELIHRKGLSQKERLLMVLSVDDCRPKQVAEIRDIAKAAGLRAVKDWNISSILSKGVVHALHVEDGWELNTDGKTHVASFGGAAPPSAATPAVATLRAHLASIADADTVAFLAESISCVEARLYRAAIVFSWVGAVSVLHKHVASTALASFNAEALRRNAKWRTAKTPEDLGKIKEHEFLDILEAIGVVGKNVKQELQGCLTLRNSCGHPNALKIGEAKVAAHLETLIQNVFGVFPA